MPKVLVFGCLFLSYVAFSWLVYTRGTEPAFTPGGNSDQVLAGKRIFQEKNCIACHQLYGLGGYIGPELTTAWSDEGRGEQYIRAFLKAGGRTMPNFRFSNTEIDAIVHYLRYVDSTAVTYK